MQLERPDTVMGRKLAGRALALVASAAPLERDPVTVDYAYDLYAPEDEQPPAHACVAAKAALDRGETHYTSGAGILPLRVALAQRSTAEGFPVNPESVVVTNGSSEALYIVLQSVLKAGDRLALAGPVAPNVVRMIEFIGATPVHLPTRSTAQFIPNPDAIRDLNPLPAALLLASPSPVSGVGVSPDQLRAIIMAASERGMPVILDRSHAWCTYVPEPQPFDAELGAGVLTTGSFSAPYALTGWRVGYLTAPEQHLARMRDLKVSMSICTSAISQQAALAALTGPSDWLDARRAAFAARRDLALALLREAGMDAIVPDAWPSLLLDTRLMHPDDHEAAAMIARDTGVRVEPATRYGPATAGFSRISLAVPEAALRDGLERIGAFHNACG